MLPQWLLCTAAVAASAYAVYCCAAFCVLPLLRAFAREEARAAAIEWRLPLRRKADKPL